MPLTSSQSTPPCPPQLVHLQLQGQQDHARLQLQDLQGPHVRALQEARPVSGGQGACGAGSRVRRCVGRGAELHWAACCGGALRVQQHRGQLGAACLQACLLTHAPLPPRSFHTPRPSLNFAHPNFKMADLFPLIDTSAYDLSMLKYLFQKEIRVRTMHQRLQRVAAAAAFDKSSWHHPVGRCMQLPLLLRCHLDACPASWAGLTPYANTSTHRAHTHTHTCAPSFHRCPR